MTVKKLLIILIAAVVTALGAGLTIFFVSNANKTIYATSITSDKSQINLNVGDQIYIMNNIKFSVEPSNCTQPIKFSINDISVCSLDSGTRKIKAKKAGTCNLRASIKSGENTYISTNITINVYDSENPQFVYATKIEKSVDTLFLSVGENYDFDKIFAISPQNCTEKPSILINNQSVCSFDENANCFIASAAGTTKATVKIKHNDSEFLTSEIDIVVCQTPQQFEFAKTVDFDAQNNNYISLNFSTDLPILATFGKIDFDYTFDENSLKIVENELNIIKILIKNAGNHNFVLSNAGFEITYKINAKLSNPLNDTDVSTGQILLQVGDTFNLENLQFEHLPENYEIEFETDVSKAEINDNILTAKDVGEFYLNIKIALNDNEKEFEIPVVISKRTVECEMETKLINEQIDIDLYVDEIVSSIAPQFDLTKITISDSNVASIISLNGSTLKLALFSKGNVTVSISSTKVDIIIALIVK